MNRDPGNRYDYGKLNNYFIVTDRWSSQVVALTDTGAWADINNPAHLKFFGLSQADARQIMNDLNAKAANTR
jgi:hypothetical protein